MFLDLSKYTIIERIGGGAFGEVFKVKHNKNDKVYAAKVSNEHLDFSDRNFHREVSIISKVHHPSILKFIGISKTDFKGDQKPVIVTDFLKNGSLEDILNLAHDGCPPPQWNDTIKLIIIYGIASAMSFLHENNIVHRDLKPANILLNQFLFPIIADFGLSKDLDTTISQSGFKGTPLYIAPEIWDDDEEKEIDYKKADVYAYAFILYEIYANEKPFAGNKLSMYKLFQKICKGERPNIRLVKKGPFKKLIESCWEQFPNDRPSFEDIIEVLEGCTFITNSIEESDYRKYISFIKSSKKSLDRSVNTTDFNTIGTKIIRVDLKKKRILPDKQYNKLNKSAQQLVNKAISDPNKQFEVGLYLVHGINGFIQDQKTGEDYLKEAIKGGNIKAVVLYNRLLIGRDFEQAKKNLKNYDEFNNPDIIFLQAIIAKKEEKYQRYIKLLRKAIKGGCAEAMFEYGIALYFGEYGLEVDKKKAEKYFKEAKENGYNKSQSSIIPPPRHIIKKQRPKFTKKIDLVILYDGTQSDKYFYNALKETFTQMAKEWIDDNPTVYFRFGAIMYTDLAFSLYTNAKKKKYPFFINLTDDVDAVQEFINQRVPRFSSIKFTNDWESGYYSLLNKINWDEDAEKVVVHMSHVPGHGRCYTMTKKLHSTYFFIPKYKENRKENRKVHKKVQGIYRRKMSKIIAELAQKDFKFYCLNGNKISSFCFWRVSDRFFKNGGKKFVVKDLFGYSCYKEEDEFVDNETLKDQFDDFFSNVIKSSVNDEDADEFEKKCKSKLKKDLKSFFQENGYTFIFHDSSDEDNDSFDEDDDSSDEDDDEPKAFSFSDYDCCYVIFAMLHT